MWDRGRLEAPLYDELLKMERALKDNFNQTWRQPCLWLSLQELIVHWLTFILVMLALMGMESFSFSFSRSVPHSIQKPTGLDQSKFELGRLANGRFSSCHVFSPFTRLESETLLKWKTCRIISINSYNQSTESLIGLFVSRYMTGASHDCTKCLQKTIRYVKSCKMCELKMVKSE